MKKTQRAVMKMSKGEVVNKYDHYVGRRCSQGGWALKESPFHNPFKGERCVYEYYKYMMADDQKELRERAKRELTGTTIGCFCNPAKGDVSCHTEVLQYICDGVMPKELAEIIEKEEAILRDIQQDKRIWESLRSTIEPLSYQDKIVGMFSCLFMGDALGAKHERNTKVKFTSEMKEGYTSSNRYNGDKRHFAPGQVTDDSEMTIILANHIAEGEIDAKILAKEYIDWAHSGQNFMGKNTVELFATIKTVKGYSDHYEKKFGFKPPFNDEPTKTSDTAENQLSNGTLMRCCSLSLLRDNGHVFRDIYLSNPSIAVEDMECDYLDAIRMALEGMPASEILDFFFRDNPERSSKFKEVIKDLRRGKKRTLRNTDTEGKGSIMSAMYATIYCLMWYVENKNPLFDITDVRPSFLNLIESLVVDFPGSDTDTNCAIMGSLMGAIIGITELEKDKVFKLNMDTIYDYSLQSDRPRPWNYHPVKMFYLYPKLFDLYSRENLE